MLRSALKLLALLIRNAEFALTRLGEMSASGCKLIQRHCIGGITLSRQIAIFFGGLAGKNRIPPIHDENPRYLLPHGPQKHSKSSALAGAIKKAIHA